MTLFDVAGTSVHIVGIGGAGMSAIARVLHSRGLIVSGSDAAASSRVDQLRELGMSVAIGHATEHVQPDVAVVIHSTAIALDNPELVAAREYSISVMTRSAALAELTSTWHVIGVSGTHGKTTTSSMLTLMLRAGGLDCSYIIGSELHATGVNAHQGQSDVAVVESDESDRTFLQLQPQIVVITNVDADHLDRWASMEALVEGFTEFARGKLKTPDLVVLCGDDAGARRVRDALVHEGHGPRIVTYGVGRENDVVIVPDVEHSDGVTFSTTGRLQLNQLRTHVPGFHNALNATAAAIAANHAGVSAKAILVGLEDYQGARRRFDKQGEVAGVRVFDDYAHHPTAVAATIAAAHQVAGDGRVIVVCQPYRWYRTALFVPEYAFVLAAADVRVLLDVYGPGEAPIAGASSLDIASHMSADGVAVEYCESKSKAIEFVAAIAKPGDVILTLGGEDIRPLGELLIAELARRSL